MVKEIQLTQGYVALVDGDDYRHVAMHRWHAVVRMRADGTALVHAARNVRRADGRQRLQYMHSLLVGTPPGMCTDHVDGNGLNNIRANLRVCTRAENVRNRRSHGGTSRYKGVCWNRSKKKWQAAIGVGDKMHHLGCFTDETAAACAYDDAALRMHGEFARPNL